MNLRSWQKDAYQQYVETNPQDFTVTATPGAGKTTLALAIAEHLLTQNRINRIIIVTPTEHLKHQWCQNARGINVNLQPNLSNQEKLPERFDGYATTYAQVARKPILHERRSSLPHRTLIIFDEIHHAGEGLTWGTGLDEAFQNAAYRLCLTGTPYRTSSDHKIPFINYLPVDDEQWESQSDYEYSYENGLQDRILRPVAFTSYTGTSTWLDENQVTRTETITNHADKKDTSAALQTAYAPDSGWVRNIIQNAHANLMKQRQTVPDAACLILANDQTAAHAYKHVVKEVTGETATVVTSDDTQATNKIKKFTNQTTPYIIAVRMVSEGVDIPRLTQLVWLTTYQTRLFFTQAVGRVIRARTPKETAHVYLPALPALLVYAKEIEISQTHLHKTKTTQEYENENEADTERSSQGMGITPLDATASIYETLTPHNTNLTLFPELNDEPTAPPTPTSTQSTNIAERENEHTQLRKAINNAAKTLANKNRTTIPTIHAQMKQATPGPDNKHADLGTLKTRLAWVRNKIHERT